MRKLSITRHKLLASDASIPERLRAAGLIPTASRVCVVQAAEAAHATGQRIMAAEEFYAALMLRGTRTSISTVYRVLDLLEGHGLLLREWDVNRKALYRLKPANFDDSPHRLVCRHCQHSVAFNDPGLPARLQAVATQAGFDLAGHSITVQVDCMGCER